VVAEARQRRWIEDNRGAIEDANAFLGKHSLWSDGKRLFWCSAMCTGTRATYPAKYLYLLDVQADLLSRFQTRVVVPLIRSAAFGRKATRIHLEFPVDGQPVVMATHLIAAVRRQILVQVVGSLRDQRDVAIAAIGRLSEI